MELTKEELSRWLLLLMCPRFGFKQYQNLKQKLSDPLVIFNFNQSQLTDFKFTPLQREFLSKGLNERCEHLLTWIYQFHVQAISIESPLYPEVLKTIHSPPLMLFCIGDSGLLDSPQLAVVGSRSPSSYGVNVTTKIVAELSHYDLTITSGLAAGVDGIAHHTALQNQANTIAVLGSGLQHIYPKRHSQLAYDIADKGLLVSEFLPDVPPIHYNFPRRNRVISGLSNGVLVTEAAIKSGSLITVDYALEQGRDVFAVPGNIFNPLSEGAHHLLKQGAKLVTCAADIVGEYQLKTESIITEQKKSLAGSNLLASVDHDTTPVDVIVQRSNLPVEQVLVELLDLEVQGLVSSVPGGYARVP